MNEKVFTWNDYKTFVAAIIQQSNSIFCRGQADSAWKLRTSFHRVADTITLPQYLDKILPEVQYNICAVYDDLTDLKSENEFASFLALVQHYGFPTPMLDWTFSPYIAAYFAYREVNDTVPQSENVKVYLFLYDAWLEEFPQPPFNLRETIEFIGVLRPFAKYNPRIIPQQSGFTVTNVDDMEAYINNKKEGFLHSVLLPVKEKPMVMKELNLMGINEITMFPSIGGICRELKTRFFSPNSLDSRRMKLDMIRKRTPKEKPI
ncbi:MAG: FRG domain-containing protein [Elusimicrobiota bacterium]